MQQLRQRVIASYHLGPLDIAETQAYIEHRLRHVGWNADPRFGADTFPLIHALTGGIPRRINSLCNRLLLAGSLAEKHVLEAADVDAVAREIQEELGPQQMRFAAEAATERGEAKVADLSLRRIEERLDRLERAVGGTIDLLHNLLHPDKAKPGGTVPR
jgi:hypothetical protein